VLIDRARHSEEMFALIFILIAAVAALLAYAVGADSRIDEVARRRGIHS
jgi:hypothetical protein